MRHRRPRRCGGPSLSRHPGSPRFRRLEHELRSASPEADAWWPRYDIAPSRAGAKRVRRQTGEELVLTYASFLVSGNQEQTLAIYRVDGQQTAA